MKDERDLWRTEDRRRWFLIPPGEAPIAGTLAIGSATGGRSALVDPAWAARFETSEEEGRAWAKDELGSTLAEVKQGLDTLLARGRARLAEDKQDAGAEEDEAAADALPALAALIRALPKVIGNGLSGEAERLESAKDKAGELELRLREAGIDLGGRLAGFPDRLAGLRSDRTPPAGD